MTKMRNIWLDGIMGVITGDALGCPVRFETREEVARHPVTGMRGKGTFNLPAGSWTDDGSLTVALLESIGRKKEIDLDDIMGNFMKWLYEGEFTPYGQSFDIGRGTMQSIGRYRQKRNPRTCGGDSDRDNGNGSLMRIMPACLYCSILRRRAASGADGMKDEPDTSGNNSFTDVDAVSVIHSVGSLTHAHIRANIACGLYYFMTYEILYGEGDLRSRMQKGLDRGFAHYETHLADTENVHFYHRLRDLDAFAALPVGKIRSTGYVVDSLEAAVWCLLNTDSLEKALLAAANLGDDTDTVAAIAGGLAGLWYGYDAIPEDWLAVIQRREWIEKLCRVDL